MASVLGKALPRPLVSTAWLDGALQSIKPAVKVLDASWYMPAKKRNAFQEFLAVKRIPGARFFDIDNIADVSQNLPHMLPSPDLFAASMSRLGIDREDAVVVYDTAGQYSASRVYWTLRVFGHESVSVLDGGLPKWELEGRPVDTRPLRESDLGALYGRTSYPVPRLDKSQVKTLQHMRSFAEAALRGEETDWIVLDARAAGRFLGTSPEPREGIKSGHMPGARNIPFDSLLNADGSFKETDELKRIFASKGVDVDAAARSPITVSCGSGVTACVLLVGLQKCGVDTSRISVYDGSQSEWGTVPGLPIETSQ